KCQKECAFEAITIANNVSYIDPDKCRLCRKCEKVCPTHAIIAVNFPAPKPRPAAETEAAKPETAKPEATKVEPEKKEEA
ncbi:MAG: 4Fe-4S binding protein, partial [Prevotella sp.]|nr:4Fe-4S binding protein [Prevotella sp.]